eukprot:CAMPEP_0183334018 /NCGR_PEP_ID=MMETSP0164_2-20130417/2735_1 /TAXON_ID=221442 /ORGANISM="Coccolithus pelagicus ssp braarudi, Strain PLY182g" /LENGTH=268 /DNA_ID=CAMNT_0025503075 /DNA_START=52 /DNA_END=858 /DNA_ORIENTATION=+
MVALALASAALGFSPTMPVYAPSSTSASVRMESKADLEALAAKLNPVVNFWDPLGLADMENMWSGESNEAAIGWLRHSEIKHGRVAMAAFVGFIVQSNGIHFPWATSLDGTTYADIAAAGGPAAQWDAVPTNAKWQIFGLISMLELWSECAMDKHYMSGGQPGKFPSFERVRKEIGHPPLDLFDPFGFSKNKTPEQKERGLLIELNNGRLAQIGIMAFVSEARVPGSVPALKGLITPYSGECMAPWGPADAASVPFVGDMLALKLPWM